MLRALHPTVKTRYHLKKLENLTRIVFITNLKFFTSLIVFHRSLELAQFFENVQILMNGGVHGGSCVSTSISILSCTRGGIVCTTEIGECSAPMCRGPGMELFVYR